MSGNLPTETSGGPCVNTDRELWRERPGDYYADSILVTEQGSIGINCGGTVYVKPVREWHKLAGGARGLSDEPATSPWVKTSDRKPTDVEHGDDEDSIIGAYIDPDGVWSMTDILWKPDMWKPPHMKAPDYWTFASLIAPGRGLTKVEPS